VRAASCPDSSKIFCTDGVFNPTFDPVFFEGQTALFQSGIIYSQTDSSTPNSLLSQCSSQSRVLISQLLQVRNEGEWDEQSEHDGNMNEQTISQYENTN
jgi:hypothetical protein